MKFFGRANTGNKSAAHNELMYKKMMFIQRGNVALKIK